MKMKSKKTKRGDSIIEVLLAVAIFSAVAVSSLAIMNRGQANVQTAVEETVVRSEIDYQAELIRFVYDGYITTPTKYNDIWEEIIGSTGGVSEIDTKCENNKLKGETEGSPSSFVLFVEGGDVKFAEKNEYSSSGGVPRAAGSGKGSDIWVTVDNKTDYYDFHINTCWYTPGSSTGTTLYTTIRLTNPTKQ